MSGALSTLNLSELVVATRSIEPVFMSRIRLRARRYVAWLQHLWATAPGALGLSISYDEVDRILADPGDVARRELAFYADDPTARELFAAIHNADLAARSDATLARVRRDFDLSPAEVDLLTLTVAVEVDPWLRRVFCFIHDDATAGLPTPWLARQLFQWSAAAQLGPDCGLVRWKLAQPLEAQPTPWSTTAAWAVDPFIASCLTHRMDIDPLLGDTVRLALPSAADGTDHRLYPNELGAMADFVRALQPSPTHDQLLAAPMDVIVVGPPGAGKRTLAVQLCALLRVPLLIVDAAALLGPGVPVAVARESIVRAIRAARLMRAAVYWHASDDVAPAVWRDAPTMPLSLFGTSGATTQPSGEGSARRTVHLPQLTQAMRAELWTRLSSRPVPAPVLDWPLLPSDIVRAAEAAPAGLEAVIEACRATLHVDSGSLASALPRPYVWADLVLPASVRRHIAELEAQARLRWQVYEDWGFGRLCAMGRGIAALFAGPSGTGKTMAAQVLARSLGMEIYRVDLAGVVSKYIGETEKNLRQVFDACERANVLLFFDEADALFGQRTQVKDAHDRFANIEIDYLLQRMEQFDGIAVLATNRKSDIDAAFLRRIRFIVDFLPPGVAERRELWVRALPTHAPNGEELLDPIDWDGLADRLSMTGADINGAAIGAAFLARSEGARISMAHVMYAARRELAKRGVVVRATDVAARP
jgi:AAA+ superfamily predicted ATPase